MTDPKVDQLHDITKELFTEISVLSEEDFDNFLEEITRPAKDQPMVRNLLLNMAKILRETNDH